MPEPRAWTRRAVVSGLCREELQDDPVELGWGLPGHRVSGAGDHVQLAALDSLVQDLPRLELDEVQASRMAQGQRLGLSDTYPDGKRRLYAAGRFIGLGELANGRLAPSRLLSSVAKAAAVANSA